MPANHRGLLAIDELNVMDKDIQPVINQPLASGTCSLNKAGHKITQQCLLVVQEEHRLVLD